jgi:hypothetical protein
MTATFGIETLYHEAGVITTTHCNNTVCSESFYTGQVPDKSENTSVLLIREYSVPGYRPMFYYTAIH